MSEPVYDVAHLGRVELLTPDLPASLAFFVDVLGWVGVLPYHVEDRLRAAGAVIASGPGRSATVVEDGRLLSGQNAAAVDALSRRLVERLRAQGVVPVR